MHALTALWLIILSIVGMLGSLQVQGAGGAFKKDFKQCANEDPTLHSCHWIGSTLQPGNSAYTEGMSVPQRILLSNIPSNAANLHTLTFSHQATKGGVHAYDFLVGYNQGNSPAMTLNHCSDFTGGLGAVCTAIRGVNQKTVSAPDDIFMSKDGFTMAKLAAYEILYGNRTIQMHSNAPISLTSLTLSHSVADEFDTGDSSIFYTLTWMSPATDILIEMAGHLSESGDGTGVSWGPGLGAASISGGPYHFRLGTLDGDSLGSQDNQIQSAAVGGGGGSSSSSSSSADSSSSVSSSDASSSDSSSSSSDASSDSSSSDSSAASSDDSSSSSDSSSSDSSVASSDSSSSDSSSSSSSDASSSDSSAASSDSSSSDSSSSSSDSSTSSSASSDSSSSSSDASSSSSADSSSSDSSAASSASSSSSSDSSSSDSSSSDSSAASSDSSSSDSSSSAGGGGGGGGSSASSSSDSSVSSSDSSSSVSSAGSSDSSVSSAQSSSQIPVSVQGDSNSDSDPGSGGGSGGRRGHGTTTTNRPTATAPAAFGGGSVPPPSAPAAATTSTQGTTTATGVAPAAFGGAAGQKLPGLPNTGRAGVPSSLPMKVLYLLLLGLGWMTLRLLAATPRHGFTTRPLYPKKTARSMF